MDARIDLTENEIFSSGSHIVLTNNTESRCPWKQGANRSDDSERTLSNEFNTWKSQLILTGNSEVRRKKREMLYYQYGEHCDCCGADLTKIPWLNKYFHLCKDCWEYLEGRERKLWRFDTSMQAKGDVAIKMNYRTHNHL